VSSVLWSELYFNGTDEVKLCKRAGELDGGYVVCILHFRRRFFFHVFVIIKKSVIVVGKRVCWFLVVPEESGG
jgi:hypothetical protein